MDNKKVVKDILIASENFEYAKCRYATNYLLTNSEMPVISASEKAKIDNCICERHK